MKCIYCLEDKPVTDFTRAEHVIPQSFGLFQDNFTLNQPGNKSVCDGCNQYFGDNLELDLGRDTVEGITRYEYRIRKPKDFKSLGSRSRIRHKKIADGVLKGAYFDLGFSKELNRVAPMPLPQVGFQNKTSPDYTYFLLDDLPSRTELENRGFNCASVRAFGDDFEVIKQVLDEKGYSPEFQSDLPSPNNQSETLLVEYETSIDSVIGRSIAKISFNYLAYWQGYEFVLQNAFDPIRSYIRNGKTSDTPFVIFRNKSILEDEPSQDFRRIIHIVTLGWALDGTSIISQVSLLNILSYTILLARNFPSPKPDLRRGHYFSLGDHRIYELTAKDISTS